MGLRINSLDKIKRKLNIQDGGPAHAYFTELCYKKMDSFVPYRNGDLRGNVNLTVDSITYESPYARYQYFGKKMIMSNGKSAFYSPDYGFWSKKGERKTLTNEDLVYHTEGTGSRWDKKMKTVHMKDIVKEVRNYVKTHGGGR